MIQDIGKFLGIYFYILACIEIILMFISQRITGDINIQISFLISFVVGYYLFNHNRKARKIVLVLSGIMMVLQFSIFIYFTIQGIPEGAHIRAWGFEISGIVSEQYIPTIFAISIIFPAIPFFLLRTKQAITEFSNKEETVISNS